MVVVKVIRHSGSGILYLQNMCRYMTDARSIAYGGYGVNPSDPYEAYTQMLTVRKQYGKMSSNPLVHIVVSLDGKCDDKEYAIQAAPKITAYFKENYQLMWCVHCADESFKHHHIHILLHSVNVMNGKLFHSGPYEINGFAYHLKKITGRPFKVYYECIND